MSGQLEQSGGGPACPGGGGVECPALDAACVTHVLRFVAPADFKACLQVNRLWYECSLDTSLPFWRVLDSESFALLNSKKQPFCACHALKAYRRLKDVLEEMDLARLHPCVWGGNPRLSAQCAAITQKLVGLLFGEGAPRLQTLRLPGAPVFPFKALHSERRLPPFSPLLPSSSFHQLADEHFTALSGGHGALPQLRTLWMPTGYHLIVGPCFSRIFQAAPQLEEVYAVDMLHALVRTHDSLHDLAGRPALRLNLLDVEPLPRAVDVVCGVCRAPLWRGLTSFCKAPPTQDHITEEWYTNEPPTEGCQTTLLSGDHAMINCANGCHAAHRLYLVDGGTGSVELHGWRYGIAVGDGTGPRGTVWGLAPPPFVGCPPLAQIVPCTDPPGADATR